MKLFTKLLIAVSLCVSFAMAGEVVVANGGPASISKDDLKNIFHGKQKKWSDGTNVTLVLLKGGAHHESFMQNVVGKTPSQF